MSIFSRRFRSTLLAGTALTLAAVIVPKSAFAATDTYTAGAANNNYNTGANYDTTTAPGAGDTAIFGNSGAANPNIIFTTATNPVTTLSFTGTTAYTFALTTGQSLNPTTSLITSDSLNAVFNMSGTGSMNIASLTNSNAGGETFATTGTGAATITGAASIGISTLTYTGNAATIGGAFTSAGGTLNLAGVTTGVSTLGSLAGSGTINLGANALLVGALASTTTYSGIISGTGSLTSSGGALTLSGANTYSGGTNITGGSIILGANNAVGSGTLAVVGGATLTMGTFNQTVTALTGAGAITASTGNLTIGGGATYTGSITSTGGELVKNTTGAEILDGANSAVATDIQGGSLQLGDATHLGATLASRVTVESGAALSGHGTITGNLVSNGTVQPGGTIGTLTVNGNYAQSPTGTLAIELNPTTTSLLAVSGTSNIAGKLLVSPDAGGTYTTGTQYTILTAGGGNAGQFQTFADTSNSVFFIETYNPGSIVLTAVNTNQTVAGETQNERNFANASRSILQSSTSSAFESNLASVFGTMQMSPGSPQVADAIGELRADSATISLANVSSFQNILIDRMGERQGLTTTHTANNGLPGTFDVAMNDTDMPMFGPSGSDSMITLDAPSVWVHGYGVLGDVGGESGYANYQTRTGGIVAGADTHVTPGSLIGVAAAYEHTDYNLSGDTDENSIDTYRASLYGSAKLDPVPLTIDAAFGYAFNDYHNSSYLPLFTGNAYSQTSRHEGNTLSAETGLSHAFKVPQNLTTGKLTLVPRVGIEYDNVQQNSFSTTGAPVRALDIFTNGSTLNALRSTIGGKADLDLKTKDGTVITPEIRASYLHDYMDTNVNLTENFTGAGAAGTGFNVQGVRPGRDAALVGTGVTVGFSQNISATLMYDADVRDHEMDNTIQAGVKYTW